MSLCQFAQLTPTVRRCDACGAEYTAGPDAPPRRRKCGNPDPRAANGSCKPCGGVPGRMVERASRAMRTAARWARNGFRVATAEEQAERAEICKVCQHFNETTCGLCGCVLALKRRIVAGVGASDCPAGLWPVIGETRDGDQPRHD